jgi:hypothetical protein
MTYVEPLAIWRIRRSNPLGTRLEMPVKQHAILASQGVMQRGTSGIRPRIFVATLAIRHRTLAGTLAKTYGTLVAMYEMQLVALAIRLTRCATLPGTRHETPRAPSSMKLENRSARMPTFARTARSAHSAIIAVPILASGSIEASVTGL